MLIENGANVDRVDHEGLTALKMVPLSDPIKTIFKRHFMRTILEAYVAMLPLEQPVYQVWWIMQLTYDTSLLNEKHMIELLQGIRNRYIAVKQGRRVVSATSSTC